MADEMERAVMALGSLRRMLSDMDEAPLDGAPPFVVPPDGKVGTWRSIMGGRQARISFPNGYEASVVRHPGSYGVEDGLWELAVCEESTGSLVYDTAITDDVIGHLSEADVNALLVRIAALEPRAAASEKVTP